MISDSKRKALEAAGYTVKGNSVLKDGKTVAGYNSNGNLFSSAGKARDILKGAEPKVEKASPKPKGGGKKAAPKKSLDPATGPRPKARPNPKSTELPRKVEGGMDKKDLPTVKIDEGTSIPPVAPIPATRRKSTVAAGRGDPRSSKAERLQIRQRPVPYSPNDKVATRPSKASELRARLRSRAPGAAMIDMGTLGDKAKMPMLPQYAKGGMVKKEKGC